MKRRDFLRYQMHGALWLAAGGAGALALSGEVLAETVPDIVVAEGDPGPATRAAVEMLGSMKAFVKPGSRVVIKPNMSFAHPVERGTNTHPLVVGELVAMCKEAGASRVLVLDHPLSDAERCMELSGIRDVCNPMGGDIVHGLSASSFYQETDIPEAGDMKSTDVMKHVLEADVLIAAPTAKSHSSAGVSLSMKGMMGLILNRSVMHWRYDLDEAIVDLAGLLRADLVVVDAQHVLTTGGPGGPGKVVNARQVIASRDMVAADAMTVASYEWYGRRFEPRQVDHIRLAHERGLGRMDVENQNVRRLSV